MMQVLFQNLIVTAGRPGIGMALGISAVAGILFFTAGNGSLYFRKPVMDISVLAESCRRYYPSCGRLD